MTSSIYRSGTARLFGRGWRRLSILELGLGLAFFGLPLPAKTLLSVAPTGAGFPLFFEAGPDRGGKPASFVARGPNYRFSIVSDQVEFALRPPSVSATPDSVHRKDAMPQLGMDMRRFQMRFVGADPAAAISGRGELEAKANYFIGNDPAGWRTRVPLFGGVQIADLYPGIALSYYADRRNIEYDFVVAPRANPSRINLQFEGIDKLFINSEGELVIRLGQSELRQHRPVLYQIVHGQRREISGGYQLKDERTACFSIGPYDSDAALVIDPVFSYSTYFGGNAGDTGLSIKVDASGAVYLAGETLSSSFPSAASGNPFQSQQHGGATTGDAFVAKLDSTGSKLLYFTYLGGSSDDGAYDLAIDANGDAFITGFTVSADFPTRNPLFGQISGTPDLKFNVYPNEAFVAELNPTGSGLIYSTFLGGSASDVGSSIAVDPAGNTYVAGYTYSANFPLVNAYQYVLGGNDDAFVAKISPGGQSLVYSTYLGGFSIDEAEGIAADADGFAYVAGYTASTNFPVTHAAWSTNLNGSGVAVTVYDAFLAKFSPNGRSLSYSTYFGGSQNDFGYRVTVDGSGNAYLVGGTQSADLPHTNAFGLTLGNNGTNAINFDAFFTKFRGNGIPEYTAQFGGTATDVAWDVAVDPAGRAFVVGITLSTDFPVVHPFGLFRTSNSGRKDVFVVGFNTNAAPVLYSGYLGGSGDDYGYAIATDAEGSAYVSGMTLSAGFPVQAGALQGSLSGSSDAFVSKIRFFDPMLRLALVNGNFQLAWPATAPDYLLQETTDLSQPQIWTTLTQTPAPGAGQYSVTFPGTNSATLFRLQRR